MVKKIKYSGYETIKYTLKQEIKAFIRHYEFVFKNAILVPIPQSKKRTKLRGFNQAEIIAKIIQEELPLPQISHFLQRNRNHALSQMTLKQRQRKTNIIAAFKINEELIPKLENKKIILIDDVKTTGSTLEEAAKTIKNHFKKNCPIIGAFTIAKT